MKTTLMRVFFFVGISYVLTLEPFTLDDFLTGKYEDSKWTGTWYSDTKILYRDINSGDYKLFDVTKPTAKAITFMRNVTLAKYRNPSITLSYNKTLVLMRYDAKPVYRHTTLAKFAVLNVADKFSELELPTAIKDSFLQTCRFSPVEDSLIVVKDNNILYIPLKEVIRGDSALWPSPFDTNIVYAKFDDTNVKQFQYPLYGEPGSWKTSASTLIGNASVIPKKPQDTQELFFFLPKNSDSDNFILYNVAWRTADNVLVTFTNREQTKSSIQQCVIRNGTCIEVFSGESKTGWIDVKPLHVTADSRVVENSQDGFGRMHVLNNNNDIKLYATNFTIEKIIGEVRNKLYVEGTLPSNHSQQHIYSINLEQNGTNECLTCDMIVFEKNCLFAKGVLSPKKTYLTRICSGPGPTYVDIINLINGTEKPIVFIDNADLRKLLEHKSMPTIEDKTININSTKFDAKVRLFLPPGMSTSKKYPMLVHVYAGPNSNQITDAYSISLQHYLVTNREYIYTLIDGRGSGKRGFELLHELYKKLGSVEIDDQITTTKNLRDSLSYIDPKRICIWGWSYGGFDTAHVLARDEGTLICGASVAPVTNFIYYDSIYTERYLGLYNDKDVVTTNIYKQTDVTKLAEKFINKTYLLIHGNADDNVHYQHSMQLARALEKADIPFTQMSYPDEAHSLSGVKPHLYHMLDAFWAKAFQVDVPPRNNNAAAQQINFVVMLVSFCAIALLCY